MCGNSKVDRSERRWVHANDIKGLRDGNIFYYKHITYITSCFKLVLWYTAYNHFLCPHSSVCWFCRIQNKTGWWTTIRLKYLNLECKSTGHIHPQIRASQIDVCEITSHVWFCLKKVFFILLLRKLLLGNPIVI